MIKFRTKAQFEGCLCCSSFKRFVSREGIPLNEGYCEVRKTPVKQQD